MFELSPTVKPRLRRAVIADTFHGLLLTGFDCTKSDVLAVMQNIHSGKYKNYYWLLFKAKKPKLSVSFALRGSKNSSLEILLNAL